MPSVRLAGTWPPETTARESTKRSASLRSRSAQLQPRILRQGLIERGPFHRAVHFPEGVQIHGYDLGWIFREKLFNRSADLFARHFSRQLVDRSILRMLDLE